MVVDRAGAMGKRAIKVGGMQPDVTDSFKVPDVAFIGEQDGKAERELKARLVMRFQSDIHVTEAYLVRVRYADAPAAKVALCVEAGDQVRSAVIDAIASEFRKMFKTDESLDILFLSPAQRERIASVADPFYRQQPYRV
jgi:hypothetical protein